MTNSLWALVFSVAKTEQELKRAENMEKSKKSADFPILFSFIHWQVAALSKVQAAEMRMTHQRRHTRDRLQSEDIRADRTTSEDHSTVYWRGTVEMVWSCEKNVDQQDCPEVPGMEAKHVRPRGRPRKWWLDNVKETVEVRGSTLKEIEQSALFLDRSQWKNVVTDRP